MSEKEEEKRLLEVSRRIATAISNRSIDEGDLLSVAMIRALQPDLMFAINEYDREYFHAFGCLMALREFGWLGIAKLNDDLDRIIASIEQLDAPGR